VEQIAKLADLRGVDRSTILRELIAIGLDSGRISVLLRQPGVKGRTAVDRVIRAVAANERVNAAQAALARSPSIKAEIDVLRAEEERAEALEAYAHHHPLGDRTPGPLR
jgi:hypothetical protein